DMHLFTVGFVDEKEDVSNYMRTSFVNNIGWYNLNAKVYGHLTVGDNNQLESSEDIAAFYQTFEE
ncbi:hypothetical protein, partial [Pseudomonas sp. 2822-17]|uniref:hypothetical protein n=1 Tax=Pseudomonas sp. 2822-17 TaxID=1712678 RepID=UPI000C62F772